MTRLGADADALDALARELQAGARVLADVIGTVRSRIEATQWIGPDAERFRRTWSMRHAPRVHRAASDLAHAARAVRVQAAEQRAASGARAEPSGTRGDRLEVVYADNERRVRDELTSTEPGSSRARALAALLEPRKGHPRQLLQFDPTGDGRVVEVFGDLAAAGSVGIFVPGMDNALDSYDARARGKGEALLEEAEEIGADDVATITWLGYDAPDALPSTEVASDALARDGADELRATIAALDLDDETRVTVVAHSYGTVVAAHALMDGLEVDGVLAMGSPGMIVDDVADFPDGAASELFSMEAPADYVTWLERFGSDPNDPATGFTRLDTGPTRFHDGYFAADSIAMENAARVIIGNDDLDRRDRYPAEIIFLPIDEARETVDSAHELLDVGLAGDVAHMLVDRPFEVVEDTVDVFGGALRGLGL